MNPLSQAFVEALEQAEGARRPAITIADVQRVAREELVHPRTVVWALAGLRGRGEAGKRAARAAARLRGEIP